jgi:two-component system chemotaxis response regulator CheY
MRRKSTKILSVLRLREKSSFSGQLGQAVVHLHVTNEGGTRRSLDPTQVGDSATALAKWELMKKVLVVDDSQSIRNEISDALGQGGFTVVEAANGSEAFSCLADHKDISLIVLDVNMPGMNGLEVLERLKTDYAVRNLPVLMLTTEAERTLVERAKKAGAKGWLLKPIKPNLLLSTVTRLAV